MTSKPKQQYRDLEKLGFLCRWALLTLVAVVTLAATWAALAGTFAISSNLDTSVILSDAVWRQGVKNPSLLGFLDGRPSRSVTRPATPLFVYSDPFRTLRLSSINNRGEIVSYLATPPAGTHHITLTGLPYGPMAFKQYQSTLRIVPAPMTVYLLDARFMAQVEQDNKQSAIRIAREFSRLGQPVLLLPGDRELLEDLQTRLEQYRDVPRVFSLRKGRTDLPSLIASVT
ncbi:MAG: hypothetical protein GY794_16830, partial [bacterium]|nr:hypothetical protein [bacterium]